MAKKSTNQTILTVAIVAVVGYMAIKLLPALKKSISGSSSGGSSGSGAYGATTAGSPYNPYYSSIPTSQQAKPNLPSVSFDFGGGKASTPANSALSYWVKSVQDQGYADASKMQNTEITALEDLNAKGLQTEALKSLDLSGVGWSADDPNAPWNLVGTSNPPDEAILADSGSDGTDTSDYESGDSGLIDDQFSYASVGFSDGVGGYDGGYGGDAGDASGY